MSKQTYDHLFKLLLIGDSSVGKTSLMCRYSHDTYNPNYVSTIGVDFIMKTIDLNGKRIKLQIWDTAGQERFQAITASFYRGAMGIMLIFDVTNGKSFDNIGRWLRNIEENSDSQDVVRMLVGNKCDLNDLRVVTTEKAEEIAMSHVIPFIETSAKTNFNVTEAFVELALRVLEKQIDKKQTEPSGTSIRQNQPNPSITTNLLNCC